MKNECLCKSVDSLTCSICKATISAALTDNASLRARVEELERENGDMKFRLQTIVSYLGHTDQDADHRFIVRLARGDALAFETARASYSLDCAACSAKDEALAECAAALNAMVDNEPCRLDHEGFCQEHGTFDRDPCVMVQARAALLRARGGQ